MHVDKLYTTYELDRNQKPVSVDHLLDYYQEKYIAEKIDIKAYRTIYSYLHKHGAKSAHEYV